MASELRGPSPRLVAEDARLQPTSVQPECLPPAYIVHAKKGQGRPQSQHSRPSAGSCLTLAPSRTGFVQFVVSGEAVHSRKGPRRQQQEKKCKSQSAVCRIKLSVSHGGTLFDAPTCRFLESKTRKILGYVHKRTLVLRMSFRED